MNSLTADLISVIASRNYQIISHQDFGFWKVIEYINQNGKYHRINGPARIFNDNDWYWYYHGKWHRDQAPAKRVVDCYYWYDMGKFVTQRIK